MNPAICYLGDDHLGGAAAYLTGVLAHYGMPVDRVDGADAPPHDFLRRAYALYVVSDYPAERFRPGEMEHIAAAVRDGAGLLMLGGWESFHGRLGEYHRTPLADVLPVTMQASDDRRNCAQPCLIHKTAEHPILEGLPWDAPPAIGGYNALGVRPGADLLLELAPFAVARCGDDYRFAPGPRAPLLVVGTFGAGRTAALATDVAPHWVGGWVDWGDRRITQSVATGFIEVGNHYARFFRNLVAWTGRLAEFARAPNVPRS